MTTRRGLFGLFAGAMAAPAMAKAVPAPVPLRSGEPLAFTPSLYPGPYKLTIHGLPPGVTFNRKTGVISGTPR